MSEFVDDNLAEIVSGLLLVKHSLRVEDPRFGFGFAGFDVVVVVFPPPRLLESDVLEQRKNDNLCCPEFYCPAFIFISKGNCSLAIFFFF